MYDERRLLFLGIEINVFGVFFFFKQKTAYEIGTGDWSSDVCSSDLFLNRDFSEPSVPKQKAIGTTHF